jgi:hypothetical protein
MMIDHSRAKADTISASGKAGSKAAGVPIALGRENHKASRTDSTARIAEKFPRQMRSTASIVESHLRVEAKFTGLIRQV